MLKLRRGQGGNPEPRNSRKLQSPKRRGLGGRRRWGQQNPGASVGTRPWLDSWASAETTGRGSAGEEAAAARDALWPREEGLGLGRNTLASLLLSLKAFHLWHPLAPVASLMDTWSQQSQVTKQRFAQMAAGGKESLFLLDHEPLFPVMWRVEPERKVELERKRGTIAEDHLKPGSTCADCGWSQHCCPGILVTGGRDALFKSSFLFLAVLGLRGCVRAFSSCGEWGLLSSCGEWGLLSSCGEWGLLSSCGAWASRCGGLSCGSWALESGLSSCGAEA